MPLDHAGVTLVFALEGSFVYATENLSFVSLFFLLGPIAWFYML